MVTFAFLGNTLFLTILVSMLSNTFSTIVSNATAEIKFRHAVMTLEGVKSDAIFAYQPPFNILAIVLLVPLKFLVSPRWFHKIHVASVRFLNLPLLLVIAIAERRKIRPRDSSPYHQTSNGVRAKARPWFWEKWHITAHSRIEAVFDLPPPDSVLDEIAADDEFTVHMIRRQFTNAGATAAGASDTQQDGAKTPQAPSRRDSVGLYPGLASQLRGALGENEEVGDITIRLEALEASTARIERLLQKLAGEVEDSTPPRDTVDGRSRMSTTRDSSSHKQ